MRKGFTIDTLTNLEIREFIKIGGNVIQIYEGVVFIEKTFKYHRLEKLLKKCLV